MIVDLENIVTYFEYDKVLTYDVYDGYRNHLNWKYKFHVKKIGKQNLVLFIEEFAPDNTDGHFISKYKAKLHKQKWRFNKKAGEQLSWNEDEVSQKLNETLVEIILLG